MQHTRFYVNSAGEVIHVATQEVPFTFDPIADDSIVSVREMVFDAVPDRFIRARELLRVLDVAEAERLRWLPGAAGLIRDLRDEQVLG